MTLAKNVCIDKLTLNTLAVYFDIYIDEKDDIYFWTTDM